MVGSTSPYTIAMWVRFQSISSHRGLISQYQSSNHWWGFYWTTSRQFTFEGPKSFENIRWTASWFPSIDIWYHIAIERETNGQGNLYVDGTKLTLTIDTNDSWSSGVADDVFIGYARGKNYSHIGWIEEVRLSDVARYGGMDFTPEIVPYGEGFVPPIEVLTVDKYYVEPQIPRVKKIRINLGFSVTPGMEIPVPIKPDKWYSINTPPARRKKVNPANVTQIIFVDFSIPTLPPVTIDQWLSQFPRPNRNKIISRPT